MSVTKTQTKTPTSPTMSQTSDPGTVLKAAKLLLDDGVPEYWRQKRLKTREFRVARGCAEVVHGIWAGWRQTLAMMEEQEKILIEKQDHENLVKLRAFRELIKDGPIIRKGQETA